MNRVLIVQHLNAYEFYLTSLENPALLAPICCVFNQYLRRFLAQEFYFIEAKLLAH